MAQGAGEVIGLDAAFRQDDGGDDPGRGVIGAEKLARTLGVPLSVLVFLEARVPQVRSLAEGTRRVYRAEDAVLIAGLTELLYGEGLTLRDVYGMMRSNGRERIAERGRARLRGALAVPSSPARRHSRPIPADARVMPKGSASAPAAPHRRPSPEAERILADLIDCVRILEAAR